MVERSKRVVFRKPKLNEKVIDLRAKAEEPIKIKPEKQLKIPDKLKPEIKIKSQPPVEESLNIPNEQEEIIQTKSKRTIIARREPELKSVTATDTFIIEDDEVAKTFDERFLDQLNIKSRITKDKKTIEKLTKPELKPTVKVKSNKKSKRKLRFSNIILLIISLLSLIWTYKLINDYVTNPSDASLASFMYIAATTLLTLISFIWFVIELIVEDKQ